MLGEEWGYHILSVHNEAFIVHLTVTVVLKEQKQRTEKERNVKKKNCYGLYSITMKRVRSKKNHYLVISMMSKVNNNRKHVYYDYPVNKFWDCIASYLC